MTETRQVWNRSKVSVILGLILFTLHIISCTTLGSRMYIWDYVAHRKGFNWNGRIKRFGQNSRISDYWSFLGRVTPSFDNSSSRNVTTQIGQTVYLHCIVHNLGDKTISSRMYIWDYVAHRKGFNWNGRIKRFGQNSRISDYWSFLGRVTPSFDNSSSRNVTTQIGQTVYLHCIVHNLGDKTVRNI
ncbi:uncharacterized protein LOC111620641 [Centruroides sculpturatus]|uniref:uncharacterized protein LOC111620641 n=1 Tax=Centruroides sculpturatus TaxID=218467 RepID=UPI000C6EF800|nr:uncharacterized protein LOC111620641 [Centruroides sculpturatus]